MPVINPTRKQFDAMLAMAPDGPVYMLNMLRFRDQAEYEADSGQTPCTGREAYQRYGAAIAGVLTGVGGRPVWQAEGLLSFIAPDGETWDECLLVRYPDISAFQAMLTNPEYQAQTFHRDAAIADSRLVITRSELIAFPQD